MNAGHRCRQTRAASASPPLFLTLVGLVVALVGCPSPGGSSATDVFGDGTSNGSLGFYADGSSSGPNGGKNPLAQVDGAPNLEPTDDPIAEPTVEYWAGDVSVVWPADDDAAQAAAHELADYLQQALPSRAIHRGSQAYGGYELHVGRTSLVTPELLGQLALHELGADGYLVKPVSDWQSLIIGSGAVGTEFGVYGYLDEMVGVRWLMPGAEGTDIPQLSELPYPLETLRRVPHFKTRGLGGLWRSSAMVNWGDHNRMYLRLPYTGHGVHRIFKPSRWLNVRPDFYANNARPTSDLDTEWQLDFSAPGVAAAAAGEVLAFFQAGNMSIPLGPNDSDDYEEQHLSNSTNLFGSREASAAYYQWCNDVAYLALEQMPAAERGNFLFSSLAYLSTAEPPDDPDFQLHPQITMWLVFERINWATPEGRARDQAWFHQWSAHASQIGWSDYQYGEFYAIPRMSSGVTAEALRWAADHGVRDYKCEFYPLWGEGPKGWILLRLLWNPHEDPDELLREWCERAVGPAAAPYLVEYYQFWENYWANVVPGLDWWAPTSHYQRFNLPDYMDGLRDKDIYHARELIDTTVALTQTPDQRARAETLASFFDYYEASALAYLAKFAHESVPVRTEQEALIALDDAVMRLEMAERRFSVVASFQNDPNYPWPWESIPYDKLRGDDWGVDNFWRIYSWALASDQVLAEVAALRSHPVTRVAREAQRLYDMAQAPTPGTLVSSDPSFETTDVWNRYQPTGARVQYVTTPVFDGQQAVTIWGSSPVGTGSVYQRFSVSPGQYMVTCQVSATGIWGASDRATVAAGVHGSYIERAVEPTVGAWQEVALPVTVYGDPGESVPLQLFAEADTGGQGKLVVDELALYRVMD